MAVAQQAQHAQPEQQTANSPLEYLGRKEAPQRHSRRYGDAYRQGVAMTNVTTMPYTLGTLLL